MYENCLFLCYRKRLIFLGNGLVESCIRTVVRRTFVYKTGTPCPCTRNLPWVKSQTWKWVQTPHICNLIIVIFLSAVPSSCCYFFSSSQNIYCFVPFRNWAEIKQRLSLLVVYLGPGSYFNESAVLCLLWKEFSFSFIWVLLQLKFKNFNSFFRTISVLPQSQSEFSL